MDRKALEKTRNELLQEFADTLNEALIPAILNEPGEGEPEIVTVMFEELGLDNDEAVGEFFFRPILSEEDVVAHFTAVITLTDEIDEAQLPALYEAMSYVNFTLPCGSFMIDREHQYLSFRLCAPLPIEMERKLLLAEMNIVSGNAIEIVDNYMNLFVSLAAGEMTLEEMLESAFA